MSAKERIEWTILGRLMGTATGWDQADTFVMTLYDFEPADGVDLPTTEFLNVDFEKGVVETFNEDGQVSFRKDLVAAIAHLPVQEVTA